MSCIVYVCIYVYSAGTILSDSAALCCDVICRDNDEDYDYIVTRRGFHFIILFYETWFDDNKVKGDNIYINNISIIIFIIIFILEKKTKKFRT